MNDNINNNSKYQELLICSNKLINGNEIFSINGNFPITIRRNDNKPIISLKALSSLDNKNLIDIIKENKPKFEFVKINSEKNKIEISVKNNKVLLIENFDNLKIEINFIDLRPIGLNIWGDKKSLNVGENTFSGNTITGAKIFMNLG